MKRSPIKPRRETPRRSERKLDPEYRAWVRTRKCYALRTIPGHQCEGPIEGDHVGRRPYGRKCDDDKMIPFCKKAHEERDAFWGDFADFNHDSMREYLDKGAAETRAEYERYGRIDPNLF